MTKLEELHRPELIATSSERAAIDVARHALMPGDLPPLGSWRTMKLPFRNYLTAPLTIIIEPGYDHYEVPAGGEAILVIDDGYPHSVEINSDHSLSIWNEGPTPASVELFGQNSFPRRKIIK